VIRRAALPLALLLASCAPAPPAPGPLPPPTAVLDSHIPRFARWPYQAFSREAAIQIALREWRAFGQPVVFPNTELPEDEERLEGLWQRIGGILVARPRPALARTGLDRHSRRERRHISSRRRR